MREAGLGATKIMMAASRGEVVLSGQVRSWRERDLAERIARATPGVTEVKDRITVVGSNTGAAWGLGLLDCGRALTAMLTVVYGTVGFTPIWAGSAVSAVS